MRASGGGRGAVDQRGAGTLLVAAVLVVIAAVATVAVLGSVIGLAQRHAANAADLAALSGAAAHERGRDACAAARRIATENTVEVTACRLDGDSLDFVVEVTVEVELHGALLPAKLTARSEAGRLGPL